MMGYALLQGLIMTTQMAVSTTMVPAKLSAAAAAGIDVGAAELMLVIRKGSCHCH